MDATDPCSSFLGSMRENNQNQMLLQQYSSTNTSYSTVAPTHAPKKKRRNQPGAPNPDAEVVALSPRTLTTTNRFICEVCNKGFQREQNLQLHRRGHNLPWKLKQKTTNKEAKKKVYICPEAACVHHDPSRALGDLTGIKKHYFRKHGEKKFKCQKCSKRYAVQSDWKAHSKICGTREYRCDCGTLFSRRDSFITHRAFCDSLASESTRNPTSLSTLRSHLFGSNPSNNILKQQMAPQTNHSPLQAPTLFFTQQDTSQLGFHQDHQPHNLTSFASKPLHQHGSTQIPDLQTSTSNVFNPDFFLNNNNSSGAMNINTDDNSWFLSPNQFSNSNFGGPSVQRDNGICNLHMSATALLQKADRIGSTTSNNSSTTLARSLANASSSAIFGGEMENHINLQGPTLDSLENRVSSNILGGWQGHNGNFGNFGGSDRLTLDFLGVGGILRNAGLSGREQRYDTSISNGSLETEKKSSQASTPF